MARLAAILLAAAAALAGCGQGGAETEAACALDAGGQDEIVEVIDGDTIVLGDGSEVRFVGIQAPKLPLGRPGFAEWPLAGQAKAAVEEMALGQRAVLRYGETREDRHGRHLAHLYVQTEGRDEIWLQGAMIERGLARVYTFPDNRACADDLLARERAARAAGKGIWSDPFYAIRAADEPQTLVGLEDTFQLVEGVVTSVAIVDGRVYLNFGQNYRQDFTITVDRRDAGRFAERGAVLKALEGRRIRVRGWVALVNGPMIEVSHPEQIELVDDDSRPR